MATQEKLLEKRDSIFEVAVIDLRIKEYVRCVTSDTVIAPMSCPQAAPMSCPDIALSAVPARA